MKTPKITNLAKSINSSSHHVNANQAKPRIGIKNIIHEVAKPRHVSALAIIVLFSASFVLGGVLLAGNQYYLGGTSPTIFPTDVIGISMQVTPASGGATLFSGSSAGNTPSIAWAPTTGKYAPVKAWLSDTWLSTTGGAYIAGNQTLTPIQAYLLGVANINSTECIYRFIQPESFSFGIRTGPLITFNFQSTTNWLTPLATKPIPIYSYGNPTPQPDGNAYLTEARGSLCMYMWLSGINGLGESTYQTNTMSASNSFNPSAVYIHNPPVSSTPAAAIRESIVPCSWQSVQPAGQYGSDYNSAYDFSTANQRVLDYCTVQPVNVVVTASVRANTEMQKAADVKIPYTFPDGTKGYIIESEVSAVVGFTDYAGAPAITGQYAGLVPNVNPANQIPTFDISQAKASQNNTPVSDIRGETPGHSGAPGLTGSVAIVGYDNSIVQAGAATFDTMSSNQTTTISGPDLGTATDNNLENNLGLPDGMIVSISNTLSPQVTVADAYTNVTWQSESQIDPAHTWQPVQTGTATIEYPYGASALNYCTVQNVTLNADIISEKNVQGFSANGVPINISSIIDTDRNSFWNNPLLDNYVVHMRNPTIVPLAWWEWVLIAFGALALIYIVFELVKARMGRNSTIIQIVK